MDSNQMNDQQMNNQQINNQEINNNPIDNQVNQANNNINNVNKENDKKGRGSFYSIIAVAVFIVMAVGATFAFFTATTQSGNSAVGTRSAKVSLEFISYGTAWSSRDLIPASTHEVEYSVEEQNDTTLKEGAKKLENTLCMDDDSNPICSIYEFQVQNPENSAQNIIVNLIADKNEFVHLRAMLYEVESLPNEDYTNTTNKTEPGENGHGDPTFIQAPPAEGEEDIKEIQIYSGGATPRELYENKSYHFGEENDPGTPLVTPVYVNRKGVKKDLLKYTDGTNIKPSIEIALPQTTEGTPENEKTVLLADKNKSGIEALSVPGNGVKTFILVLYIENTPNEDQTDDDSQKEFTGTIEIKNADGSEDGIYGKISGASSKQLQSEITSTPEPTTEPTPEP